MKWVDALKIWNSKRERWGVPRKGTPEHAEVRAIMGKEKPTASARARAVAMRPPVPPRKPRARKQVEEPQAPTPRTPRTPIHAPIPRTPLPIRISESSSIIGGMAGQSEASSARSSRPRTPGLLEGEMPASTRSSAAGPGLGGSSGSRSSGASSAASRNANSIFEEFSDAITLTIREGGYDDNLRSFFFVIERNMFAIDRNPDLNPEEQENLFSELKEWFRDNMVMRDGDFRHSDIDENFEKLINGIKQAARNRGIRCLVYEEYVNPPYGADLDNQALENLVTIFYPEASVDYDIDYEEFREQEEGEDDDDYWNERTDYEEDASYNYTLTVKIPRRIPRSGASSASS